MISVKRIPVKKENASKTAPMPMAMMCMHAIASSVTRARNVMSANGIPVKMEGNANHRKILKINVNASLVMEAMNAKSTSTNVILHPASTENVKISLITTTATVMPSLRDCAAIKVSVLGIVN